MKTYQTLIISFLAIIMAIGVSCNKSKSIAPARVEESAMLLQWLTENGNWINSKEVPAVITSDQAYEAMQGNSLFIDLRDPFDYAAGHIPGALNVQPTDLLDFLDNRMDINAFDKVVFVCNRGQLSAWVNAIVRMLGYNNTFSIRFGLSAWETAHAAFGWDKKVSDDGVNLLVKEKAVVPQMQYERPNISTGLHSGYEIAHRRASELLAEPSNRHFIEFDTLLSNYDQHFVISYWPSTDFEQVGHLPGAWQFSPRKSLSPDALLMNIPNNKKVVVYCFTGHHSAHATAFLRMLGYDAYSLLHGGNSFMHSMMNKEGWPPSHQWSNAQKRNFQLESNEIQPTVNVTKVKATAQGGC